MVVGSCTDFTTVFAVLKHAKMVSDVLELYIPIIMFDIAIFIQRKPNKSKLSRRIFKHRDSSWRITHRTELPVFVG